MKQRLFTLLAVMMAVLLAVGVSAAAGMYTCDSYDGDYRTPENAMLEATTAALWLEDGIAAGYSDPNYTDETGAVYLSKLESGWYEVVLCGLGSYADDFPEEVNGKIAFCIRGDSTFTIKSQNAKNAGAVACLVGNNCRPDEKIDFNGNVTGKYENTTMNMNYYTVPAASLSSDITVRLVAATADVTIAEAVNKVTEISAHGALEFGLEHKQTARVFLGTEKEYWDSFGLEENTWHTYRTLQWKFEENTGTLTIAGEGAIGSTWVNRYPWYVYSSKITSVMIEKGITNLPRNAISSLGYNYTEICLPASLEKMDADELNWKYSLKTITISEDNKRYYVNYGILFENANDGIHLLVYPQTKKDITSYTVPEGVTRICKGAFFTNQTLTELILPDSLEVIEDTALQLWLIQTLHIPANVKSFSPVGIFCDSLTAYTIDPDNTEYTVVDGILYTKDMTQLIAYPKSHPGTTYTVPDSVTIIPNSLFLKTSNIRTLTIPASVTKIIDANGYSLGRAYMSEIIVDPDNPNYCSVDGVLYSKDMKTLIFYPPYKKNAVYRMPDTVTDMGYGAMIVLSCLEDLHLSPNLSKWGSYYNTFGSAFALKSVYFYCDYNSGIASAFQPLSYSGKLDQMTFYYPSDRKNWPSPTLAIGSGNVRTATFEPWDGALDIPGDITDDGKADADDLLDLANYFAGHTDTAIETILENEEIFEKVAAFDDNPEDFSRYDAMYIARALAGWEGYDLP